MQADPTNRTSPETLEYWTNDLVEDPVVLEVVQSQAFRRLSGISFLGAIDYIAPAKGLRKQPRSRAAHSINVAALANFVATQRGYSADLKRHLIVAGLLHDIGHAPLSHSVEPYFKEKLGIGHHELGEITLRGQSPKSKQLHALLADNLDVSFIIRLIDGNTSRDQGGDLFSSAINIDTIEGIIRTYRFLTDDNAALDKLAVASASFLVEDESRYRTLDKFWKLKGFIYRGFINDQLGLVADKYSQHFFSSSNFKLTESELFDGETSWMKKYGKLFSDLNKIASSSMIPEEMKGRELEYTSRNYTISHECLDSRRYAYSKEKRKMVVGFKQNKKIEVFSEFTNTNREFDL